jgi:hypothetical protein
MKTRNRYLRDKTEEKKVARFSFGPAIEILKIGEHTSVPALYYLNARVACSYYNRKLRPNSFRTELDTEKAVVRIIRDK